MTISEIKALSEEELKALALQKDKKGNATEDAYYAQGLLWERGNHWSETKFNISPDEKTDIDEVDEPSGMMNCCKNCDQRCKYTLKDYFDRNRKYTYCPVLTEEIEGLGAI